MPGPYGVVWRGEDERGKGGRQPSPFPVDGLHSKVAGRACSAPMDCCFRQRGFGGTPEF